MPSSVRALSTGCDVIIVQDIGMAVTGFIWRRWAEEHLSEMYSSINLTLEMASVKRGTVNISGLII